MFALTYEGFGNQQIALFAAFGGFASLIVASFGGSRRDKLMAHLGLTVTGSIALIIGTAVNGIEWLGRAGHDPGRVRNFLRRSCRAEHGLRGQRRAVRLPAAGGHARHRERDPGPAEASVPPAAAELNWELARVADGLTDVLHDVREISRGIHPAILSERGLGPAVKALARRSPVPVDLTVRVAGRLPDRVQLGAYYIVSEALANVAKHANAEMVMVSVEAGRGVLSLSVRGDGVGGADPDGSGLAHLRERAEALGGTLRLASVPGRGTSVDVRLPVMAR